MHLTEKSYEQVTNALLLCGSHFKETKDATNAFCERVNTFMFLIAFGCAGMFNSG